MLANNNAIFRFRWPGGVARGCVEEFSDTFMVNHFLLNDRRKGMTYEIRNHIYNMSKHGACFLMLHRCEIAMNSCGYS